jgi:hypothetical protein
MRSTTWKRHHDSLIKIALGLSVALALVAVGSASVNTPGPTAFLELDLPANLGFDGLPGSSFDWANGGANTIGGCISTGGIVNCSGTGGIFDGGTFNGATTPPTAPQITAAASANKNILAADFGVDPLSVDVTACGTGDPTVYTSVGSEVNGDDLNTETYTTGSVPNKDEISNVYAISHQDPPNPVVPSPSDTNEIFAGFERVVNNGDSHVDLEFLQQSVTLVPGSKPATFPCNGKFQGDRTQGDLLLSVDFTTGGTVGTQILHKWVCGNVTPPASGICNPTKAKGGPHYEQVSDLVTLAAVKQRINDGGPVGCGGWGCRNSDGTQTSTINTNQLYEVGIDLAAVGFTGCINTFLPHTRSSQSFTATLKDFELVQFNTCRPSTILTKTVDKADVTVGDTVTYTYVEENDGQVSLTNPFVTDDKCSPVTYASGDTNNNGVLDVGEKWTFTCTLHNVTANTTNTAIGHGTFTVGGISKDVTFCDPNVPPPDNTVCDPEERAQAHVTVHTPGTILTKVAVPTVKTTVSYAYMEANAGDVSLSPPVPGNLSSFVTDAQCGAVVYVSGDVNNNGKLDPQEAFMFTCTKVFDGPGSFTNIAIGHGIDNLSRDVTFCAPGEPTTGKFCDPREIDTKTVNVTVTVSGGK